MEKGGGNNKKVTIFYDGDCPMCRTLIKKVERSSQNETFRTVNATKDALPPSLDKGAVLKEIHVQDGVGNTYRNAGAILKILEAYPRYRLLAQMGRLPIIKQILRVGYRFVAANRYFIFGKARNL